MRVHVLYVLYGQCTVLTFVLQIVADKAVNGLFDVVNCRVKSAK